MSRRVCSKHARTHAVAGLTLALLAAGATVCAQSNPAQDAAAIAQRNAGIEHLRAGRAAEAAEAFQHSLSIVDSPNTRLDLGRAYVALGRVASAVRELERARDMAAARIEAGQTQYTGTRRAAAEEADAVRPRVPTIAISFSQPPPQGTEVVIGDTHLPAAALIAPVPVDPGEAHLVLRGPAVREQRVDRTLAEGAHEQARFEIELVAYVRVAVSPSTPGLRVNLDDHALTPEELGAAMPVTPGAHVIAASAPGFHPARENRTLGAGERSDVAIELRPNRPLGAGSGTGPARPPESGLGALQWVGITLASVGLVGAVGGVIAWSMADDQFNTLVAQCGANPCTTQAQFDRLSQGQTLETTSMVLLVAGSVLTATGVVLAIAGRPQRASPPPVQPTVRLHGAGFSLSF